MEIWTPISVLHCGWCKKDRDLRVGEYVGNCVPMKCGRCGSLKTVWMMRWGIEEGSGVIYVIDEEEI